MAGKTWDDMGYRDVVPYHGMVWDMWAELPYHCWYGMGSQWDWDVPRIYYPMEPLGRDVPWDIPYLSGHYLRMKDAVGYYSIVSFTFYEEALENFRNRFRNFSKASSSALSMKMPCRFNSKSIMRLRFLRFAVTPK